MSWLPLLWAFLSLLWPFMSILSESLMKHGVRITFLLLKERFNSYRNGRYNIDEVSSIGLIHVDVTMA